MTTDVKSWNPLFDAYARAHGMTVEQRLKQNEIDWPGGRAVGFMLFISAMNQRFRVVHPECMLDRCSIRDFDAWERFVTVESFEDGFVEMARRYSSPGGGLGDLTIMSKEIENWRSDDV